MCTENQYEFTMFHRLPLKTELSRKARENVPGINWIYGLITSVEYPHSIIELDLEFFELEELIPWPQMQRPFEEHCQT